MPNPKTTLQDDVINDIRNQPVGSHRLSDFDLPDDFLRRVADRLLRSAFEKKFRLVVRDWDQGQEATAPSSATIGFGSGPPESSIIRLVDHIDDPATQDWRDSLIESRPALRGFRAPLLAQRNQVWPMTAPADWSGSETKAADCVASNLAKVGLVPTLAAVIDLFGTAVEWKSVPSLETLKTVGLPVDLLMWFHPPGQSHGEPLIPWIASLLRSGRRPDDSIFRQAEFTVAPSLPSFRVATESGENDASAIRLQLTRGSYWHGSGDGGNLDLTRQVLDHLANTAAFIHVESKFLAEAQQLFESWGTSSSDRITFISEPRVVSQWAHDNGKAGFALDQPATIVPRFASRGEDGSTFVPGDTFLLDGFHDAGAAVCQSPLLFQGGNLFAVRNPQTGERILLIGEAEIHRNRALGLNPRQVLEAFQFEFGVDRCEVLPAASFHIDYDLTVRAIGSRMVAFVNDNLAACQIILECGVGAMARHSLIDPSNAEKAMRRLQRADHRGFLEILGPAIGAFMNPAGHLPASVAEKFSVSAVDSGVGNLHRLMLALDILIAISTPHARLASIDPHGYYSALERGERTTANLHRTLSQLGFQLVKVPSLSAGDLSVTFINGVQLKSAYLMPSYGGLLAPLDSAAKTVFEKHLGPSVPVIPIRSGESQRRNGAVHCSVSLLAAKLVNLGN